MSAESKHREPLRVWHREGLDYAIARTAEEAHAAWCDHVGEVVPAEDYCAWNPVSDDYALRIWCDFRGHVCAVDDDEGGSQPITRTAAEWAARYEQPLFLCSTEA